MCSLIYFLRFFFFFIETATTETVTYGHTLSRHDALQVCIGALPGYRLPRYPVVACGRRARAVAAFAVTPVFGIVRAPRGRVGRRRKACRSRNRAIRSEEHTSELQSLMRISYAVFCLKKKKTTTIKSTTRTRDELDY